MKFTISRDELLKPLQLVAGVVEKRQTLPVLANILVVLDGDRLSLTGTDLEVEMVAHLSLPQPGEGGEVTVPARKFVDICRSLPEGAEIHFALDDDRVTLRSGNSRFVLSTLPSSNFPNVEQGAGQLQFTCSQSLIRSLIDSTAFAMAQQDVRYYLNGMLWEVQNQQLRCVSTDGHRLAMCTKAVDVAVEGKLQCIVPRKGIQELSRLLSEDDEAVEITLGDKHIQVATPGLTFTSKLVDGKFPDYERVLPRAGSNTVLADRQALRQAFGRVAILSNEKYRGVRLTLADNTMVLVANNPEQDEAEERLPVDYSGEEQSIGFNINYLLDVANVMDTEQMRMSFIDANTSALIEAPDGGDALYVVMPMRL